MATTRSTGTLPLHGDPPPSEDDRLVIRLLGPVVVLIDGTPLAVDTRKAIALLAFLAVTDRPASRESLAALLWPDSDEAAARGALRRTLSVLRSALGGFGLEVDRSSVALAGGPVVDVQRFRAALARARAHRHAVDEPCPDCLAALDEALGLDRGDFMAGFSLRDSEAFEEWQLVESEAHRRELTGALERLARGRAAGADWSGALAAGRRWLELDELHEPAHRLLMTMLARVGEPAAAVRQFRDCVRILDAELGVAPLQETIELYEEIRAGRIGAGLPAIARPSTQVAPQRSGVAPLVGRDGALDTLLAAHRAVGPDGRLLVIEGEPGIGKSRLAAAFADAVRSRGGIVLEARAYAGEESIAFAPITALLRAGSEAPGAVDRLSSVRPDLLEAAGRLVLLQTSSRSDRVREGANARRIPGGEGGLDPFGRARLIEGLAEVLTALAGGPVPGVLIIDDLDWADVSTLDVVAYLGHRLEGRPLALLATWRPLEPSDDARRRLLVTAVRDGLAERVGLERLGRADVAALARAVLGDAATNELVDAVFAESEGLPLYVAEALAVEPIAVGSIPGGVLALLRSRIASVGEVAGQILGAGSVIGRSFDFETVREASGRSEEETIGGLEELIRRGLIKEAGASDGDVRFDFTHGRLRDVTYESLGLLRRRLLHRRVAEALRAAAADVGEAGARWSRIAQHEREAGRFADAAEAHRRAGEDALRMFANHEAREHFETALALGHPASAELHEALGEVLTLLGDYAGAIAHLEAAAATGRPGRDAGIEHALALVYARRADWHRAASHATAALAAAPDDPIVRSALLADRSAIARRAGDPVAAERLAHEALDVAEGAEDAAGIARACQVLGALARARDDLDAARAFLERSLEASAAVDDPGLRIAALNTLALVLAAAGDRAGAIVLILDALECCERLGDRHRQAALENNLADLLRADGRREEAMVHLKRAVALFVEIGGRPGVLEPEIWKLVEW